MGVGFHHASAEGHHCPHWAYGGFHRFRERLAAAEGFRLDDMHGFKPLSLGDSAWTDRSWDDVDTPLRPLLDHSDCDGALTIDECVQVLPRLLEIVERWPDDEEHRYDRTNGLALVDCMVACLSFDTKLRFC